MGNWPNELCNDLITWGFLTFDLTCFVVEPPPPYSACTEWHKCGVLSLPLVCRWVCWGGGDVQRRPALIGGTQRQTQNWFTTGTASHQTWNSWQTLTGKENSADMLIFSFTSLSSQRLHATHNLMGLLNAKHPGIPPTLRDDRLKEEVSVCEYIEFLS